MIGHDVKMPTVAERRRVEFGWWNMRDDLYRTTRDNGWKSVTGFGCPSNIDHKDMASQPETFRFVAAFSVTAEGARATCDDVAKFATELHRDAPYFNGFEFFVSSRTVMETTNFVTGDVSGSVQFEIRVRRCETP